MYAASLVTVPNNDLQWTPFYLRFSTPDFTYFAVFCQEHNCSLFTENSDIGDFSVEHMYSFLVMGWQRPRLLSLKWRNNWMRARICLLQYLNSRENDIFELHV